MLGKLMFWKKDDDLRLDDDIGLPKSSSMPHNDLALDTQGLPKQSELPPQDISMENFKNSPERSLGGFRDPPQRMMSQEPQPHSMFQQPAYGQNKDMEIISAKLDSLKATLESINQRIANLERIAYGEDDSKRGQWR